MDGNIHEERARAVKAFKLARICEHMMGINPDITVAHMAQCDEVMRLRVARAARVRVPSEATWELVIEMLHAFARRDATPGSVRADDDDAAP